MQRTARSYAPAGRKGADRLALIRTILALIILLILVHVGMVYAGVGRATNQLVAAVYSLGALLESPAAALLDALPMEQQDLVNPNSFFFVALAAAAGYFILYLLLGVGRRS
jgi:hypothetical protein